MIKPDFENWWLLHNYLLARKKQMERERTSCDSISDKLHSSSTVKIRIEYSHHFASEVCRLRMDDKSGDEQRCDFEAWLFFMRSTLDCMAQFINDICNLGMSEADVKISVLLSVLKKNRSLEHLYALLSDSIDNSRGTWFWHLNQLRNHSTHRTVVKLIQFCYIGSPAPKRDDYHFTLEDPCDPKSFVNKPELGLGQYAEDKFDRIYVLVENVCDLLYKDIKAGKIDIS